MYRYFFSYMFYDLNGWGYGNGEKETTTPIDTMESIRDLEKSICDTSWAKVVILNINKLKEV